jgi:hypothetical protein
LYSFTKRAFSKTYILVGMPRRTIKPVYILIGITVILLLFLVYRTPIREPFQAQHQPTIDLVVARYKEPLDWLDAYKGTPFRRIYIYNKSESPVECPKWQTACNVESLPNVGVCDHTYLYHILKVYDDPTLADMTVFLPASAASSSMKKNKIQKILDAAKAGKASMSGYKAHDNPADDKLGGPSFHLDEWKVSDAKNRDAGADFQLVKANPRPFGAWYAKFFPGERMETVSLMGMFGVTRDMILSNPESLYKSLIATVERDKFPEAAHYMERSWGTLFRPEQLL